MFGNTEEQKKQTDKQTQNKNTNGGVSNFFFSHYFHYLLVVSNLVMYRNDANRFVEDFVEESSFIGGFPC